eukprot:gene14169-1491_t
MLHPDGLSDAVIMKLLLEKNQPLEITKIRAGRSKPGLKAQHLTGLQLVAQICDGHLHGGELNSTAIKLLPGAAGTGSSSRGGGAFTGDTKTAGSICLLLQAALPCALFAGGPCTLKLKGGTNAEMAPQYDYFEHVFLPIASKFGFTAKPEVEARGYFPRGGGVVKLGVDPVVGKLKAITLTDRGHVTHVKIRAFHAGKVPQKVATTMAETAEAMISAEFTAAKAKVAIEVEVISEASAIGNGCGLLLVATTTTGCIFGGSALGKPKVKANVTGEKAAKELLSALQHGGCVDEWLQDQLIIFMALAEGTSEIKTGSLTLHTKTAITFATELCGASFDIIHLPEDGGSLNDVVVRGNGGGSNSNGTSSQAPAYGQAGKEEGRFLIRCKGVGHENI